MWESSVVRALVGFGFIFFGFNQVYIIKKKIKGRNNPRNTQNEQGHTFGKPRIISRVGVMVMNIFIILCFLNIIFYNWFSSIIPRIVNFSMDLVIRFSGFGLVLMGNTLLFYSYRELGTSWAYPIDGGTKTKRIVKTGIYSKIRHPVYLSFNIFSIGFNLILLDWMILIIYLFGGIGLYLLAIDEEQILLSSFKDEYRDYMRYTGRFLPKILNH